MAHHLNQPPAPGCLSLRSPVNCPPYGLLSPVSRVGISQPGRKGPIALCPGGLHLGEGVEGSVRGCVRDSFAGEGWVGCRADNCGRGLQRYKSSALGQVPWIGLSKPSSASVSPCSPSTPTESALRSEHPFRIAVGATQPSCLSVPIALGGRVIFSTFFCLFLSVCVSIFLDVDGW